MARPHRVALEKTVQVEVTLYCTYYPHHRATENDDGNEPCVESRPENTDRGAL